MGKKVLAIYYSQSGQLADIMARLTAPLVDAGASVEYVRIEPIPDYPFPWTTERFYSVMPDCVLGVTGRLAPFQLKETSYDLIVLGYQAWFLYPSIPVNTLLHDPAFRQVLNGYSGCDRNGCKEYVAEYLPGIKEADPRRQMAGWSAILR